MPIAALQKVLIVAHKSEQCLLLDRLQSEGFVHISPAGHSSLKEHFDQIPQSQSLSRDSELQRSRLAECISFLGPYVPRPASLRERFAPRAALPIEDYEHAVRRSNADGLLSDAQDLRERLTKIDTRLDRLVQQLLIVEPWQTLDAPLESLGSSKRSVILAGMVPNNQDWDELKAALAQAGVAIDTIKQTQDLHYCILAYAQSSAESARHAIHKIDFEPASFETLVGKPTAIIIDTKKELHQLNEQRQKILDQVSQLAKRVEAFGILHDHFQHLSSRDQVIDQALATPSSRFFEGWIRCGNWEKLQTVVNQFPACTVEKATPDQDEEPPIYLQNRKAFRPFEVITSLYGMPGEKDLDPTPYLAPFFAIFFGLCLSDAGYGLVLLIASMIGIKLLGKGSAKLMAVLAIGGGMSVILGGITNGYFGDSVNLIGWPWLTSMRDYLLQFGFDPFKRPMVFFVVSISVGYLQLMTGLFVGLIHQIYRKDFLAAACDHLNWIVMLNSLVIIMLAKAGLLPGWPMPLFLVLISLAATSIIFASHREGSRGERIGMGMFNLFSTIFYLGDVLSYLRLMGLGLVTGGIAMSVNLLAGLAWEFPYVGGVACVIVLVGGHIGNLLLSSLSAFVHTVRLQYVEFFPKFFEGGGYEFQPFERVWTYTRIET